MRQPATRFVLLFFMALFVGAMSPREAAADARSDAKAHYQAGVKSYAGADYRTAIKEFSAAQQLAPADLNNYNLALCYDKLGEAEPAIQYYKEYLAKVPNADKRTEIEASVARLEGALQSAATKRAEEVKRSEEARKAEQARLDEEMRKAAEQKKIDDAKAGATVPVPPTGGGTATPPPTGGTGSTDRSVGSSGTPGTGQVVSTGDAQLDRASAIDINAVRDQRVGMGTADPRGGNGPAGAQGAQGPQGPQAGVGAQASTNAPNRGTAPDPNAPVDQPKKATPIYKKWWFWAVVAVSAFVVYQIVTTDSNASTTRQGLDTTYARPVPSAPDTRGVPIFSF